MRLTVEQWRALSDEEREVYGAVGQFVRGPRADQCAFVRQRLGMLETRGLAEERDGVWSLTARGLEVAKAVRSLARSSSGTRAPRPAEVEATVVINTTAAARSGGGSGGGWWTTVFRKMGGV